MIRCTFPLLFLVFAVTVAGAQQSLRTWTWMNGRQTLKARLIGVENGRAIIKGSGKEMGIPISRLSQPDQELVRKFVEDQANATANKPAKQPQTISLDDLPESEKELFKFIRATKDWQRVPVDRRQLTKTVKELRHRDLSVRKKALVTLALVRPDPSVAGDVLDAVKQARPNVGADFYKNTFAAINTSWGNALRMASVLKQAGSLAKLERMLGSTSLMDRDKAMCALQWTYEPKAAEILVKHYEALKAAPRKYLQNMGPVAAPAVAQMLTAPNAKTRRDAVSILEDIGTSAQLADIQRLQLDPDGLVRVKATAAAKKIQASGR